MERTLKLLALLFFLTCAAPAQVVNRQIAYVTVAPSGACSATGIDLLAPNGILYTCQSGMWAAATSAGGGGTAGAPANSIQYNNAGAFGGMGGSLWDDPTRLLKLNDINGNNIFLVSADPAGGGGCGVFYINCDQARPAAVSGPTGTSGGPIEFDAPYGGDTTIVTTGTGGNGGSIIFNCGDGGFALNAGTQSNGGAGGLCKIISGNGAHASVADSQNNGGTAGDLRLTTGIGGQAAGTGTAANISGNSGNIILAAAPGQSNLAVGASNIAGNAGDIIAIINAGGTGNTANGSNGNFRVNAGSGDSPVLDVFKVSYTGLQSTVGAVSIGTKFTTSGGGCTVTGTTGGATAGSFTTSTTGTCTTTLTMNGATGLTAPNGWSCDARNITAGHLAVANQTATTQTTCTIAVATTSGDTIVFNAMGY